VELPSRSLTRFATRMNSGRSIVWATRVSAADPAAVVETMKLRYRELVLPDLPA